MNKVVSISSIGIGYNSKGITHTGVFTEIFKDEKANLKNVFSWIKKSFKDFESSSSCSNDIKFKILISKITDEKMFFKQIIVDPKKLINKTKK